MGNIQMLLEQTGPMLCNKAEIAIRVNAIHKTPNQPAESHGAM
jgi:hypothetical protein